MPVRISRLVTFGLAAAFAALAGCGEEKPLAPELPRVYVQSVK
ncbi:RND family efflux transporter MFP subunit, partial [Pseudomonas syringae pv. actinidiae ICMP 18804]